MPFRGFIPSHVQKVIHEVTEGWPCRDVYVGCSGNFTIERVLEGRDFRLHGNDVTLYSCLLGSYLARQELPVALTDLGQQEFPWLARYLCTQEDALAAVMLAANLMLAISAKGERKRNAYYERVVNGYLAQWDALHAATVERLRAVTLRLASFHIGDVTEWIKTLPADQGFLAYPPFGAAGAGLYRVGGERLSLVFKWNDPPYTTLQGDDADAFFRAVAEHFDNWCLATNRPIEEFAGSLRGMTKPTNRAATVYIYASSGPIRVVSPHQALDPVLAPRLVPGQEIGDTMTLALLDYKQFQALRSQYMNVFLRPGAASQAVAVLVDGYLVGVYALSTAPTFSTLATVDSVYLLSDFPVRPTDYGKLAKLVLYAALSKEGKLLAERSAGHRVRHVVTTAFSNNPESMKYRGLFTLVSRKDNPTSHESWGQGIDLAANEYYARRYQLNYRAEVGRWTLAEGLAEWKRRHGGKSRDRNED